VRAGLPASEADPGFKVDVLKFRMSSKPNAALFVANEQGKTANVARPVVARSGIDA
jgi:hypothetical protein